MGDVVHFEGEQIDLHRKEQIRLLRASRPKNQIEMILADLSPAELEILRRELNERALLAEIETRH